MKAVAVIGSRCIDDYDVVSKAIADGLAELHIQMTTLVSGGAEGVDSLAEEWARRRGVPTKIFRPQYKIYGKKIAPMMRNHQIIAHSDAVIAVVRGRSKGTRHALSLARARDIPRFVRTA